MYICNIHIIYTHTHICRRFVFLLSFSAPLVIRSACWFWLSRRVLDSSDGEFAVQQNCSTQDQKAAVRKRTRPRPNMSPPPQGSTPPSRATPRDQALDMWPLWGTLALRLPEQDCPRTPVTLTRHCPRVTYLVSVCLKQSTFCTSYEVFLKIASFPLPGTQPLKYHLSLFEWLLFRWCPGLMQALAELMPLMSLVGFSSQGVTLEVLAPLALAVFDKR